MSSSITSNFLIFFKFSESKSSVGTFKQFFCTCSTSSFVKNLGMMTKRRELEKLAGEAVVIAFYRFTYNGFGILPDKIRNNDNSKLIGFKN